MVSRDIQKIGRYENLTLLGQGGMGAVYRGRDPELERQVAIKVMLDATPDFVARFRREAQAIARLTHPHIVQVFDFGVDQEGNPYFVMELVEGRPLDKILQERGALPPAEAVELARQAAEGLAAAHKVGIVHRDIKPSNLIIDPKGQVKLVDFGIARVQSSGLKLTAAAALMGTPGYMAPEQAMGRQVDHRADVYALGLTLFEMLTGKPPFTADDPISLVVKNMNDPLPVVKLRASGVPDALVGLVEQMAAKEPQERIQSADAVIQALGAVVPGRARDAAHADTDRIPPTNVHLDREELVATTKRPGHHPLALVAALAVVGAAAISVGVVLLVRKNQGPSTTLGSGALVPAETHPVGQPIVQNDVAVGMKPTTPAAASPPDKAAPHPSGTGALTGPLRIGILSFKALASDPDAKQLADGVAETTPDTFFTKHKALREHVRVVERMSLDGAIGELDRAGDFHFNKDAVMKAGEQKGAQVLVVGGVQKASGKYRVSARFVRVEDGEVLDTFQITSRAKDPFKAQDELAEGLADKLFALAGTWRK